MMINPIVNTNSIFLCVEFRNDALMLKLSNPKKAAHLDHITNKNHFNHHVSSSIFIAPFDWKDPLTAAYNIRGLSPKSPIGACLPYQSFSYVVMPQFLIQSFDEKISIQMSPPSVFIWNFMYVHRGNWVGLRCFSSHESQPGEARMEVAEKVAEAMPQTNGMPKSSEEVWCKFYFHSTLHSGIFVRNYHGDLH